MSHDDFSVLLVRHAETAWSLSGQHTGRTDIELTSDGEAASRRLGTLLDDFTFDRVLTSPLVRARQTCNLAGFEDAAVDVPDLMEWDYGDYEGITTEDIRKDTPDWNLWRDGAPGGEMPTEVQERADRLVARLEDSDGRTLVFGHGHMLRALAVRWTKLPLPTGAALLLDAAAVSRLEIDRGVRAIATWNDTHHLD